MKKEIERTAPVGWLGSLADMAAYSGVSRRTIQRWASNGTLKVRRLSAKKILCRPCDLDAAIAEVSDRAEMEA